MEMMRAQSGKISNAIDVEKKQDYSQSKKLAFGLKFFNFLKYFVAVVLTLFFLLEVYNGVLKVKDKKMTLTSSSQFEKLFTYPSFTICITMDTNFTNGFNNQKWLEPSKYDFSFPFPEFGVVEDSFLTRQLGIFHSMNDPKVLDKIGISHEEVWKPSITGIFREPSRCFNYQPKGSRGAGFKKSIKFRIKSRDDPAIAFFVGIHNHGAFVPNLARVFGNDYTLVFARKGQFLGTRFEVSRSNFTELSRADHPCSNDPELYQNDQPGLIMGPDGPTTLEQCLINFFHANLMCRLPWSHEKIVRGSNGDILENCTKDEQYLKFKDLIQQVDDASDSTFWNLIGCSQRCTFTKFHIAPIYDSNFNALEYVTGQSDDAIVDISFFFPSPEIEITERILVYGQNDLVADIGGCLGLFLGASLYTVADVLVGYLEKLVHRQKPIN